MSRPRVGAIVAGHDRPEVDALTSYGTNFEMVFQIVDDIWDITSTNTKLGKPLTFVERDRALAIVRDGSGLRKAIDSAREYVAMAQSPCDQLPSGDVTDALRAAPAPLLDSVTV